MPEDAFPLGESDIALEEALAAIQRAFACINLLPHDHRAETWKEAQGSLAAAYRTLRDVR